ELAVNLGFSDQSHFHKAFKAHTGVTPRQFQLAVAQ
ncbi:AraC family transcriptional regulator, partial [Acinetobacter baumannii]